MRSGAQDLAILFQIALPLLIADLLAPQMLLPYAFSLLFPRDSIPGRGVFSAAPIKSVAGSGREKNAWPTNVIELARAGLSPPCVSFSSPWCTKLSDPVGRLVSVGSVPLSPPMSRAPLAFFFSGRLCSRLPRSLEKQRFLNHLKPAGWLPVGRDVLSLAVLGWAHGDSMPIG